jgi:lipoprotein-anchoring transpeptidase ErfK/SrfK
MDVKHLSARLSGVMRPINVRNWLNKLAAAIFYRKVRRFWARLPGLVRQINVRNWFTKFAAAISYRKVRRFLARLPGLARQRWFWLSGCAAIAVLITLAVLIGLSENPPLSKFDRARAALALARQTEASRYAPELLQQAEERWERARLAWHKENNKWSAAREFQGAANLADQAAGLAKKAAKLAAATKDSLRWFTAASITLVKEKIIEFKMQFNTMPFSDPLRQKFVTGELLTTESELAFLRNDYLLAAKKIQAAASHLGSASNKAAGFLKSYLANIPQWQRWAAETIAWSANYNRTAIIVEKMASRCRVYVDGKLKAEYPVELGPRWLGHKRKKGDGATPEGCYRVIKKKSGRQTKYYKALEIDYPNQIDRERFRVAQERGEFPQNAHLGGLIEIHGDGGKGVNWTSGCVALSNANMDKLFELAKVGTPVTIVGALKNNPTLNRTLREMREVLGDRANQVSKNIKKGRTYE